MADPYQGREQTKTKHFILKRYLQALAFKILTFKDIAYIDGFSGPWETQTEDFRDSSFMIAIDVLKDAQNKIQNDGRKIRCFLVEKNPKAYSQLQKAVLPFHQPEKGFEIKTYNGEFVNAVKEIEGFIGDSFPLIFIDPTGWSGFPFEQIKQLFDKPKCEVLINFMYDHINRFAHSEDSTIINSLNSILGGSGWQDRLDSNLQKGIAVEKLFRETLRETGKFKYVVSTKIDKPTVDRPHFCIAYGTKSYKGLKAFRDVEYSALLMHEENRSNAKERKREDRWQMKDLFSSQDAERQEAVIDDIVDKQKELATEYLLQLLSKEGALQFERIVSELLQAFILRETNVKDICVELANENQIEKTWGKGNRKPDDATTISLTDKGIHN